MDMRSDPIFTETTIALKKVEQEIAALLERLTSADELMYRYIHQRISRLDQQKAALQKRIHTTFSRRDDQKDCVCPADWNQLSFSDKRRVVELLIETICVTQNCIQIKWRI